ncbi:hypothetical protein [Vibrio hepatarius]|uniref:hypothetical protein n=1 Tax=Vibrio hepatarius TaxID=171383 RepID=UPI001C09DB52|nr:hypothetical protein [Vibrio hepatarius]MBU2895132.1 hypothetical protein [Vibrio hepatarius]
MAKKSSTTVKNSVKFFENTIASSFKTNINCQIIEKKLEKEISNARDPRTEEIVCYKRPKALVDKSINLLLPTLGPLVNRSQLQSSLDYPALTYGNLASDINSMMALRNVPEIGDIEIEEGEKSFSQSEKCIDITLANDSMLEITMDLTKREVMLSQAGQIKKEDFTALGVLKEVIQELLIDFTLKSES